MWVSHLRFFASGAFLLLRRTGRNVVPGPDAPKPLRSASLFYRKLSDTINLHAPIFAFIAHLQTLGTQTAALGLLVFAPSLMAATAFLPLADDRPDVLRLDMGSPWPANAAAEEGTHIASSRLLPLRDDSAVSLSLPPGAYAVGAQLWIIRRGNGVAEHARSLIGMPVLNLQTGEERAESAAMARGYDHLSLIVHSWRLADRLPWPWVAGAQVFGGLAGLMDRHNPTRDGYARQGDAWVDETGKPIAIDEAFPLGGIISSTIGDLRSTMAILVEDRGVPGILDAKDLVVTTQDGDGSPLEQVSELSVGNRFGPYPLHLFTRNREKGERRLEGRIDLETNTVIPGGRRRSPDNPIWDMDGKRVWMAVAGLALVCFALMRMARKRRSG